MTNDNVTETCANCGNSENDAPIIQFKFKGETLWICSSCMPTLIHKPDQLISRLVKSDDIQVL